MVSTLATIGRLTQS